MKRDTFLQYIKTSMNFMHLLAAVCFLTSIGAFALSSNNDLRMEVYEIHLSNTLENQEKMREDIEALRSENATLQYQIGELQMQDHDTKDLLQDCRETNIDQDEALEDLEGFVDYIHDGLKPWAWSEPRC